MENKYITVAYRLYAVTNGAVSYTHLTLPTT